MNSARAETRVSLPHFMFLADTSSYADFSFSFLSILLEGAPYILLGTIISGLIDAFLPSNLLERLLPKNRTGAILLSGLLGGVFPVCECAIVPVIRRLVSKGLPVGCAVTYMLSAPIINPIVIISTMAAFSKQGPWTMTVSRLAMAYGITVFIGLVVSFFSSRSILRKGVGVAHEDGETPPPKPAPDTRDFNQKLISAMRTAQKDFLDTAMYFVIGVTITSIFKLLQYGSFHSVMTSVAGQDLLAVPMMMVLAFVLSLCSTTDAFIVAPMDLFSKASKLAFLVFGPMMDVKLVFMYLTVFRPRFVIALIIGLFVMINVLIVPWKLIVLGE